MAETILTDTKEEIALLFVADLVAGAIIEGGGPLKISEVVRAINREDVGLPLARVALASFPERFTQSDRKWTLWTRFASVEYPFERHVEEIFTAIGRPVTVRAVASELAVVYGRPLEHSMSLVRRFLQGSDKFFAVGDDRYGLRAWLLNAESETEEDVLFDNFLSEFDLAPYTDAAQILRGGDLESVVAFLDTVAEPVPNRVLQMLVWRADPGTFHPAAFFSALINDGRCFLLSDGTWVGPKAQESLSQYFGALAQRPVEETGAAAAAAAPMPLEISDESREELVQAVLQSEGPVRASRLLADIFEVTPSDATYAGDLETVVRELSNDSRVLWVGSDRFLPDGAVPGYVYSVPDVLKFPEAVYLDSEGEMVDVLLEPAGFDGGLEREVQLPVVQDVGDEEPMEPSDSPPVTARCVLKFHHKEIGTLPLCHLPPGFFPTSPNILEVTLTLPSNQKLELWVNNETRLIYGLLDWYMTLPVDSGAVFYLERQAPDHYVLTYGEETEPAMFVSRNRLQELMALGQRAEEEGLPTFDILAAIMEHYRKGIEFVTAHTELNIARRTRRHMVASLLSGYHCFYQRGKAWVYDQKKRSQGLDRSKRKFVVKS